MEKLEIKDLSTIVGGTWSVSYPDPLGGGRPIIVNFDKRHDATLYIQDNNLGDVATLTHVRVAHTH